MREKKKKKTGKPEIGIVPEQNMTVFKVWDQTQGLVMQNEDSSQLYPNIT